jgi:hypothetical protein
MHESISTYLTILPERRRSPHTIRQTNQEDTIILQHRQLERGRQPSQCLGETSASLMRKSYSFDNPAGNCNCSFAKLNGTRSCSTIVSTIPES